MAERMDESASLASAAQQDRVRIPHRGIRRKPYPILDKFVPGLFTPIRGAVFLFMAERMDESASLANAARQDWVRIPHRGIRRKPYPILRQQKTHFCLPTKVRFLNDVCLRQMMLASPMMTASPDDVWLSHIFGKHRIIAERSGATSF